MSLDLSLGVGDGATSLSGRVERWRTASSVVPDGAVVSTARNTGPVRFADADTKERACRDAGLGRSIVLRPRADTPGGLSSGIDGDLESALALRGALPSGLMDSASLEDRLRDQISRALCVPVKGVCLALPPLGACVEADGVLADVDARYLGAWLRAAAARPLPISILFDEQDRALLARVPRSLEDVLADLRGEPARALAPKLGVGAAPAPAPAAALTDDVAAMSQVVAQAQKVLPFEQPNAASLAGAEAMSIPDLIGLGAESPVVSPAVVKTNVAAEVVEEETVVGVTVEVAFSAAESDVQQAGSRPVKCRAVVIRPYLVCPWYVAAVT